MMNNKSINRNKQFMIGNGILAFGVFFVICLFLYLAFRSQDKKREQQSFEGIYTIELTESFANDSISVYINDSLLFNKTLQATTEKFQINRFAEENMLMVVDNNSEEITPFNLSPKGSLVKIEKKNGKVFIEEIEYKQKPSL